MNEPEPIKMKLNQKQNCSFITITISVKIVKEKNTEISRIFHCHKNL